MRCRLLLPGAPQGSSQRQRIAMPAHLACAERKGAEAPSSFANLNGTQRLLTSLSARLKAFRSFVAKS